VVDHSERSATRFGDRDQLGLSNDRISPADFDGDQKADIAVYREGVWYVVASSNSSVIINNWGTSGDVPVPADYNNDGSAEFAVYRPSTGAWWILNPNGTFSSTPFGLPTDVPTRATTTATARWIARSIEEQLNG
jgi:hypothetical protein